MDKYCIIATFLGCMDVCFVGEIGKYNISIEQKDDSNGEKCILKLGKENKNEKYTNEKLN